VGLEPKLLPQPLPPKSRNLRLGPCNSAARTATLFSRARVVVTGLQAMLRPKFSAVSVRVGMKQSLLWPIAQMESGINPVLSHESMIRFRLHRPSSSKRSWAKRRSTRCRSCTHLELPILPRLLGGDKTQHAPVNAKHEPGRCCAATRNAQRRRPQQRRRGGSSCGLP
jgi:hypothetical protein